MPNTTIFEVKTAGQDGSRYVEAVSSSDAFQHVAGEYFSATAVKAAGLRKLLAERAEIERTVKVTKMSAPKAEEPKAEEKQGETAAA